MKTAISAAALFYVTRGGTGRRSANSVIMDGAVIGEEHCRRHEFLSKPDFRGEARQLLVGSRRARTTPVTDPGAAQERLNTKNNRIFTIRCRERGYLKQKAI